ncbi:MAG: phosphoenolpyruvate carboxylase [Parvularculaceae bacterium]|nr:phosphoenolpyruvate carboxylase [Parvularculaceae bacterium]
MSKKDNPSLSELKNWCFAELARHEETAQRDPLSSSVRILTISLWNRLASGEIDRSDLADLARELSDAGLRSRAARLRGKTRPGEWADTVSQSLEPLENLSFEEVCARLGETAAGIVFTAHPTFALSRAMREIVGRLAAHDDDAELGRGPHRPDQPITLLDEHEDVQAAIARAQDSIRGLFEAVFDWLRSRFPDRWREAAPRLISLATWVGYDLDGRTDIHWGHTLRLRLEEKALQLFRYARTLSEIPGGAEIAETLLDAGEEAAQQAQLFAQNLDDPAAIVEAANRLTDARPGRLTSLETVKRKIAGLIAASDETSQKTLCVLKSEMEAYGLGVARIHLRVNAAQIRSALRTEFGLAAGREFLDRTALDEAAAKSAAVKKKAVNFGSVSLEQMTARRQLMLCAQMLKHVDSDTPLRFLIAEVEAPATIMGAIYLARLYGVDHKLDISPLFETPDAIEMGGRFIERLLEEKEFLSYIKKRGRIAIQCGFSDSGRFMGQIAANMAIERLHILVSRALAAKDISDIEVVIFNTHGESMGRGGRGGDFGARLDHLITPWARARFAHDKLPLNSECSFQGGDGFLHFQTKQLSDATVRSIFQWSQKKPNARRDDRFYSDINFSWDVYRAIKGWQESLFADPNYQSALSTFAPGILPATGSRKTRRQSGASKADAARSLRAIPHNAVLQQLAAPANVLGGMGTAAAREPERFARLIRSSHRMRGLFSMAASARRLTSLSILRAYASLYDPGFWTVRAARASGDAERAIPLKVAERLSDKSLDVGLDRLANFLSVDRQLFDSACRRLDEPECADEAFNKELYTLHAIRMALIVDGFSLVASTPPFSPRHELTRESLIDAALDLKFAEIAEIIEEIFPETEAEPAEFARLDEPADSEMRPGGYPQISREIAAPLRKLDERIKDIAVGISHFYDAFG